MSVWTNMFTTRWAQNYWNHLNGKSQAQTVFEPHVAALGEIYQAQRPFPGHHRIADFCIPGRSLIIELDGKEHRQPKKRAKDAEDDAKLARNGWTVVRINNEVVLDNPKKALEDALEKASLLQQLEV